MEHFSLMDIKNATAHREPNFQNLLTVLDGKCPDRPTLFEFFLNDGLECRLTERTAFPATEEDYAKMHIDAFRIAGYDYVTITASKFTFHGDGKEEGKKSISLNEGAQIIDRDTLSSYHWVEPESYYDGYPERIAHLLPPGMQFIIHAPDGILENTIRLVGYENLCYLLYDDPELVKEVVDQIGSRLYRYYQAVIGVDAVGAIICNDDWGFNQQTMLPVDVMRTTVFPWYKKITGLAKEHGKPVILHSCGNLDAVYDDIVSMGISAKHSYEDKIEPVEQAYDRLHGKLAVVGGIDIDFVCRSTPAEIYDRSRAMITKTKCDGYALGTGNSIPGYLPDENYFAMLAGALIEP